MQYCFLFAAVNSKSFAIRLSLDRAFSCGATAGVCAGAAAGAASLRLKITKGSGEGEAFGYGEHEMVSGYGAARRVCNTLM